MFNQKIFFDIPGWDIHIAKGNAKNKKQLCRKHFHAELEFLYVEKGAIRFFTDNESFDVNEGDIFFVNSNIPHHTECIEDGTIDILLQFTSSSHTPSSISYLFGYIKKEESRFFHFKNNEENTEILKKLILEMIKEKSHKKRAYDYYIAAYVQCIEALLHRNNLLPDPIDFLKNKKYEKLLPVFEYIDKNYSEKINLTGLSQVMHLNKSYLCRLFKEITGNGISEYINYVRIHKAVQMLKSDKTISEIAYECGFLSLAYFNRVFKKYKFYAPNEYRKIMVQGI